MLVPWLSVIICTHNPQVDRLNRVLHSLSIQTLSPDYWELIVIDNCSDFAVKENVVFPAMFSSLRILSEPELGLTPARLKGITEAKASILVFVDDDNILSPTYLAEAMNLMENEPQVGAAGGIIEAEYEIPPQPWSESYLNLLGIRNFGERPIRALVYNQVGPWEPIGAGMVIRKHIAEHYQQLANNPLRRQMDRIGKSLGSCGDTDMVRCATDLGYYLAYQPELRMTHLIPEFRLRYRYFLNLSRSLKRSGILLDRIRTGQPKPLKSSLHKWLRLPLESARQFTPNLQVWLLRIFSVIGELEARLIPLDLKRE